jgi:hypothetical protein
MHLHKKKPKPKTPETHSDESTVSTDASLAAHTHNVAVPEVRTGKVDVDGEFHEQQHNEAHHHQGVSFDTLAVPEYHTGKCPHYDPEKHKHEHKHHGALYDLARIIANGGEEE